MKQIRKSEAIDRVIEGEDAYMLVPVTLLTTIEELAVARGFCCRKDVPETKTPDAAKPAVTEAEKPKEKKVDHGKIISLYKGHWPVKEIADDVGCSLQTVINHLKKEGIYKEQKTQGGGERK